MSGSSAANRMLFDNKIFKVSLPTLSTDATLEELNNHMFHVVGDKVAVQAGGAYVQTVVYHHCGVMKKSSATMPSGMGDDDVWYFHDDPESLGVQYPDENSKRYTPKTKEGDQQTNKGKVPHERDKWETPMHRVV